MALVSVGEKCLFFGFGMLVPEACGWVGTRVCSDAGTLSHGFPRQGARGAYFATQQNHLSPSTRTRVGKPTDSPAAMAWVNSAGSLCPLGFPGWEARWTHHDGTCDIMTSCDMPRAYKSPRTPLAGACVALVCLVGHSGRALARLEDLAPYWFSRKIRKTGSAGSDPWVNPFQHFLGFLIPSGRLAHTMGPFPREALAAS